MSYKSFWFLCCKSASLTFLPVFLVHCLLGVASFLLAVVSPTMFLLDTSLWNEALTESCDERSNLLTNYV